MSVLISVKLYRDFSQQDFPERFMTLSYRTGGDPTNRLAEFGNEVVTEVLRTLSDSVTWNPEHKPVPEFDSIEVNYNGYKITKHMASSLIKIET